MMKLTPLENWIIDKTGVKEHNRAALQAYQLEKMIETLGYAKENSRFYSKQLGQIDLSNIHSIEDIQALPFTYPEDIKYQPFDFLCVSQSVVKRIVTLNTSGTSGDEKRIYFTQEDLDFTIDFFRYGMSCLTDENDNVLVLLPGSSFGSIGDLLKKALALSGTRCIVYGVLRDLEEVERIIEENNITCIVGIPMQVLYLSRRKSEVFKRRIKKVLLSTDYVPEVLIHELTQEYECSVFSHYGMTEMGYGGGVECEALNGYHMREADLYFEIINPETGQVVEDGQYGEVVFTTLGRQAMPLIRYRTGDIAAFSHEPCSCGTFLKTVKKVLGRMDNKVVLNDREEIYLRELDEIILFHKEVMDYKASINDRNSLVIEITVNSSEYYDIIKEELTCKLQEVFYNKIDYRIVLEIRWKQDDGTSKITNSMIKRKIFDYRNFRE